MNNKLKSISFKLLEKLPHSLGNEIYHQIQRIKTNDKELKRRMEAQQQTFAKMAQLLADHQINLSNKKVMEIGSGWLPLLPYLLRMKLKVRELFTIDIEKHFIKLIVEHVNNYVISKFDLKPSDFYLQGNLRILKGIKYIPNYNWQQKYSTFNFDFAYSRFVLEHVPLKTICEMHKNLYMQVGEEAKILHFISPSDHRAYTDRSISVYDFLKYGKNEWNNIQTRFDYHNRLRLPVYREIFTNAGFNILYENFKNPSDVEISQTFRQIKLHPDFNSFSLEELTASNLIFILSKRSN